MISARQQIAIVTAAVAGIVEGRGAATPETIIGPTPASGSSTSMHEESRALPPELEEEEGQRVISKPFELALRNIVACEKLHEDCDCYTVFEAGRRVGEAAGEVVGAPVVMLMLGDGGFVLRGTVSLVCNAL